LPTPAGPVAKMLYPATCASSPNAIASFARLADRAVDRLHLLGGREAERIGSADTPELVRVEFIRATPL